MVVGAFPFSTQLSFCPSIAWFFFYIFLTSAIRNIVARNRQLCTAFLDESAERYINQAMASHASCADDAKAALRDLGCKVELRELWTGMPQKEAEPGPGNVVSGPASEAVSGVTINVD